MGTSGYIDIMATKLTFANKTEFDKAVEARDFRISQSIVEGIFKASRNKTKIAHILEIDFEEEYQTHYLSLRKAEWKSSLEKCIGDYEKQELYEDCIKIQQLIKTLENEKVETGNREV